MNLDMFGMADAADIIEKLGDFIFRLNLSFN